jgi:hypothetical protein
MDEVIKVGTVGEGATEIVDNEAKCDISEFVAEQAWSVSALGVAESTEVCAEPLLAESASLRQAVHTAGNFEVDGVTMKIVV